METQPSWSILWLLCIRCFLFVANLILVQHRFFFSFSKWFYSHVDLIVVFAFVPACLAKLIFQWWITLLTFWFDHETEVILCMVWSWDWGPGWCLHSTSIVSPNSKMSNAKSHQHRSAINVILVITILCVFRFDLNAPDEHGDSAIHKAARNGRLVICQLLVEVCLLIFFLVLDQKTIQIFLCIEFSKIYIGLFVLRHRCACEVICCSSRIPRNWTCHQVTILVRNLKRKESAVAKEDEASVEDTASERNVALNKDAFPDMIHFPTTKCSVSHTFALDFFNLQTILIIMWSCHYYLTHSDSSNRNF